MENEAFEMHGAAGPGPKEEFKGKPGSVSMLKIFFLCLLASLITTAVAILALALIGRARGAEFPKNPARDPAASEGTGKSIDPKFQFLHHLSKAKIHKYPGGEMQWARFRKNLRDYENLEELEFGLSINGRRSQISVGMLRIRRRGLRVPHWHLNANEHGVLLEGTAWVGVVGPDGGEATTFAVRAGQAVFFPRNWVHWVQNVGHGECVWVLFFSTHEELRTLGAEQAFFGTPEDVAARALRPEGGVGFIRKFRKAREEEPIKLPATPEWPIPNSSWPQSAEANVARFFYDLKGSAEFPFRGGVFQWARFRENGTGLAERERIFSQSLHEHENTLTLATLKIFGNHLGQPHFHFNANEMGFVVSGCGQAGLTLPSSSLTFPLSIGDVVFFPAGSQHFIQSFCQEPLLLVLAYSTGSQLQTLRMEQYFHGIPKHILAQLFHKEPAEFQKIPKD
ncbi:oxalate decarboxylase OxdC-like [Aphelocoma coerulescens]|uniref:oxalate decarboxylase OxdC-like n=1 Tax=Aphelocoma coerulescens TaxID=39617 RepID=UPI003604D30F